MCDTLSDFNQIWSLSTDFRKSPISNLVKILPVGAALLKVDRRTDMTKLTDDFLDLCERVFKAEENPVLDIRFFSRDANRLPTAYETEAVLPC
jgi:hypothetical protein